jgi:hypothetical protein
MIVKLRIRRLNRVFPLFYQCLPMDEVTFNFNIIISALTAHSLPLLVTIFGTYKLQRVKFMGWKDVQEFSEELE